MNAREQKQLQRYVEQIAGLMGLRDWEIEVERDAPRAGDIAQSFTTYGQRFGQLRFVPGFMTKVPIRRQKSTVIHELLHFVHSQAQDQVRVVGAGVMSKRLHQHFTASWFHVHEYAVDGLAEALADLFPDPPWHR